MSAPTEKAFHVSPRGNETVKQSPISCNAVRNSNETPSLKGLAHKVLLRNSQCNKVETNPVFDETESREPFDCEAFNERAAIIESNSLPREWAEGYATLCTMPRLSVYTMERWQQIVDDGGKFLDRRGRQAAELGWRATDVFGVSPDAPERRYDGMGLVPLLQGRPIVAITTGTARIDCGSGTFLIFDRKIMTTGAVSIWELKYGC